jgi:two-component system LytT family response regulator
VVRYSKGKGGYVTMKNNQELEVSANKKQELLNLFER